MGRLSHFSRVGGIGGRRMSGRARRCLQSGGEHGPKSTDAAALRNAHFTFENGHYVEAAAQALAERAAQPADLAGGHGTMIRRVTRALPRPSRGLEPREVH